MLRRVFVRIICTLSFVFPVIAQPQTIAADSLLKRIEQLENRLIGVELDMWRINSEKVITIDPSQTERFSRIVSNNGVFLISLKNVEPYLDGVKVTLSIGNIQNASFEGFKLNVTWGARQPESGNDWLAWYNELKSKEFSFTNSLIAGAWNTITINLPQISPTKFGHLSLSLNNDVVLLKSAN